MRYICAALIALLLCSSAVRADDFGPARDVRAVDIAAKRLLAHRVRPTDPSTIAISDTVIVKDQALLTWRAGSHEALMGLVRYADRWWDAFDEDVNDLCRRSETNFPLKSGFGTYFLPPADALLEAGFSQSFVSVASAHSNELIHVPALRHALCDSLSPHGFSILNGGANIHVVRTTTSGYDLFLRYGANDARPETHLTSLRARAPSPSEFLPLSVPFAASGYGTGVVFLYVDTDAKKPIAFQKGGTFDVWVPWMLDDSVRYELEFYTGKTQVGPVKATVYDNVLHFDLPAFSLPPGETMGEVDGYF